MAIFFALPPTFSTRKAGYSLFDFLCYANCVGVQPEGEEQGAL